MGSAVFLKEICSGISAISVIFDTRMQINETIWASLEKTIVEDLNPQSWNCH